MAKNETEIVMRDKGFFRRSVTEEFVGDMSSHLRDAAQSIPVSIYCADRQEKDGFHTHLQYKSTHLFAYSRLTELRLNTMWRFTGDKLDRVFPCFRRDETNDYGASYNWPLPKNMALWLIGMWGGPLKPGKDPTTGATVSLEKTMLCGLLVKAYLVAINIEKKSGFFRLPLCNIYEDASICMGDGVPQEVNNGPIISRYKAMAEHVRISGWNNHLRDYQTVEDTKAIFQLDLKGKPIKGFDNEDWYKHSKKVNNTNYSELGLHELTSLGW